MRKPDSTYRLQLSPQFTFEDLKQVLDYLDELGISTIYSAPFFQARAGSTHGYDVTDPFTINREIGKLEDFREIGDSLKAKNMSWLQDIVPNHMAYDAGNIWLRDIFELGPASRFYNFFDINWQYKGQYKGQEKVMAPFLGAPLEEILERKELQIQQDESGFSLAYYDNVYPLSNKSYPYILAEANEKSLGGKFENFDGNEQEWQDLKISVLRQIAGDKKVGAAIKGALEKINNSPGEIKEIVELQYFIPTYWKQTEKEINYRRFFTINDLICLRMEDPKVFETYHYFIKELCEMGFINGLRLDHIDGLFDPQQYLEALEKMLGKDFYVIVEKILEAGENLRKDWPVDGTSGYEFLAQVNHLFTKAANEEVFSNGYASISPKVGAYEDLVYSKKLFILTERMGGELENLWILFKDKGLVPEEEHQREKAWKEALSAFLAAFPVYRIYPRDFPLSAEEQEVINHAVDKAKEKAPESEEELTEIKRLFLGEANKDKRDMLYFVQRCQQFSGPLAAKGVEDTSFYIYNRLVSHNEVGDSPENFGMGIDLFHKKMKERREKFPLSINATATHDTKRGEDARMRLDVLSEMPHEWFSKVGEWREINEEVRQNRSVPGPNEEYFIYQTLLAGKPFEEEEDFISRTCDYLQKVLREAKVHSNWAEPNEEYEKDVFNFVKDIWGNSRFRNSFNPFQEKIAGLGAVKSLGQTLIKITAPGIPDTYQGTELWDLSYVDPDNRRAVDYSLREGYLSEFKGFNIDDLQNELKRLRRDFSTGKIKMFITYKALSFRRKYKELFRTGDYLPLQLEGEFSENYIAYARTSGQDHVIIIVPVAVLDIFDEKDLSLRKNPGELTIILPEGFPSEWKNLLTSNTINTKHLEGQLHAGEALDNFPVALLQNKQ